MATRVEAESDGISATVRSPILRFRSDFISSLPDEILHHILSYIPTKYAIRTSVLSKRWKHVWRETPSLSFQCHTSDHLNSITETLATFTAPKLTSFHIDVTTFNNFDSWIEVSVSRGARLTSSHVASWIELAVSRGAEEMSLVLIGSDNAFPDFFFTNSSVKQLRLALGDRGSYNFRDLVPKCKVLWTSLRSLTLECCTLPDESLANILSGCPVLESLVLINCQDLFLLDLSKLLKLTRLEIICLFFGPSKIIAPHVHYLKWTGSLDPCTLVDV